MTVVVQARSTAYSINPTAPTTITHAPTPKFVWLDVTFMVACNSPSSTRRTSTDLAGMLAFVAAGSLTYRDNVDASMLRLEWFDVDFDNGFPMGRLFGWFGDHSRSVFVSCVWAYLILQVAGKFRLVLGPPARQAEEVDYGTVRQRRYFGLSLFVLPALFSVYKSLPDDGASKPVTDRCLRENIQFCRRHLWSKRSLQKYRHQ